MPFRVAVLRIDGDHESLQHVEAACDRRLGVVHACDADRVTSAGFGLLQRANHGRQQPGDRRAVLREGRQAGTDRHGKPFGGLELEAQVDKRGADPLDGRLELDHALGVRHEQELVGTVAPDQHRFGDVPLHELHEGDQDVIAGAVPVVVVQQPEVVDVDQGHAKRNAYSPGALELLAQEADQRAVRQRPRQRVPPGRLDQRSLLPKEPPLGRPEDQEQDRSSDEPRAEGQHDHVVADAGEPFEDGAGIAPDRNDCPHRPAAACWQELTEQGRGAEGGRAGSGAGRVCRHQPGPGRSGDGEGELAVDRGSGAGERRIVGGEDGAVGQAKLDVEDLAGSGQRCEL